MFKKRQTLQAFTESYSNGNIRISIVCQKKDSYECVVLFVLTVDVKEKLPYLHGAVNPAYREAEILNRIAVYAGYDLECSGFSVPVYIFSEAELRKFFSIAVSKYNKNYGVMGQKSPVGKGKI